ncbi:MAG TPA: C1 family peptidase [Draconibacterium sp.]|nr:C1 family peptidase [Draconibacterium sp.]
MKDEFKKFTKEQAATLKKRIVSVPDGEVKKWFTTEKKEVKFRVHAKTHQNLAELLDEDLDMDSETIEKLEANEIKDDELLSRINEKRDENKDYETFEVTLIHPDDFDFEPELDEEDQKSEKTINADVTTLKSYYAQDTLEASTNISLIESDSMGLPSVIDHRSEQSPVKNQYSRGTCVAHASCGVLEAFDHIPEDLSEQYLHYKFNEFIGRPQNADQGLKTTDSAKYLARNDGKICLESEWPYLSTQAQVNSLVSAGNYGPSAEASGNQTYGVKYYKIIQDNGLAGESIKNTRYLEALLYQGYNIVIGTWVAWQDTDNDGILEPRFSNGNPIYSGGHAMVVVGYNKIKNYFIVKNSWGAGWGHAGYAYLSYDYIRTYFKYGYVVKQPVPYEPQRVPGRLLRAPYSYSKISRSRLRTAIIAFKTSKGRYAVCEAYAGTNLYLKNIMVYNANGTVHLKRSGLVIRGTYLCDIDSGRETSNDADFWWQAVRPGVNYLVPRNGAKVCVLYDMKYLTASRINNLSINDAGVPSGKLNFAVVVGKTTTNRPYKAIMHLESNNRLEISYLEVLNNDGSRYKYKRGVMVSSSYTYNVDTLQTGGGRYADLWWHVISDNVGFVEKYSSARIELLYYI